LGWVSDAQSQIRSGSEVVIPPHDFKEQSRWYYHVQKDRTYLFAVVTHGITAIPNLINFRHAVL
jgi:hypothetical protein